MLRYVKRTLCSVNGAEEKELIVQKQFYQDGECDHYCLQSGLIDDGFD